MRWLGAVDKRLSATIDNRGSILFEPGSAELTQKHKDMLRAEIAPKISGLNYICPVVGAKEEMEKIDPELVSNPLIFPTDADLAKAHVFRSLEADEETTLNSEFQSAIGA